MVAHRISIFFCCLFVLLVSGLQQAHAEPELQATVERTLIYENDTLNLRLVGNFDMELSFGGILNFGRNQVGSPDTAELEKDFEILDQQQSYNMQSINGKTTSQVTWSYTLAPRKTGKLSIPAIEYKGAQSKAIAIKVMPGAAPKNADNPPAVFLEVEVDKQQVYVQEQLLFTVRLFASDHLASGDWSDPAPADAIVESLGDTKKFFRMAYNQRYEVRERKFLIFPQKSGELAIEPQSFSGILIDTRSRRRQRVREFSEALSVNVKAPPASFSGDTWLPASSLHITESWESEPDEIKVGDSVTRSVEIRALGLLGSALPPITTGDVRGLKVYPDQPAIESFEHKSGVESVRKETTALVAVQSGTVRLPEVRIPWWDTVNDVERVAVLPARQLEIQGGAATASPAAPDDLPQTLSSAPLDTQASDSNSASLPADVQGAGLGEGTASNSTPSTNHQPWYALIALLLLGWASTSWFLWQRLQQIKGQVKEDNNGATATTDLKQLKQAINSDDPDWPQMLISRINEINPGIRINNIRDLERFNPELAALVAAYERQLYASGAAAPGKESESSYDKKQLLNILDSLARKKKEHSQNKRSALMPFYP